MVKNMTAEQFFGLFTEIMAFGNMPAPADPVMNETLKNIGITPGVLQNWVMLPTDN